jgi:hypothetical protein
MPTRPFRLAPRRRDPDAPREPIPRGELGGLTPLRRVVAQLDALGLRPRPTYEGYVSRCPAHRGEGENFEVV